MSDIIKQIENLTREQALEAAQYLALKISEGRAAGEREEQLLKPLIDEPYAHIEEIEQLSRLLLIAAAVTDGYEEAVQSAIEGAGRKQFILGGSEIVALSLIALYALHTVLTGGKLSEKTITKTEEKDGKTVSSTSVIITYSQISDSLGKILTGLLPKR